MSLVKTMHLPFTWYNIYWIVD